MRILRYQVAGIIITHNFVPKAFGTADDIKPDTRALLTLPDAAELQLDEQVQRIRHQIRFCSTQLNELLHLQCTSMQPDFSAESVEPDSFA